METRNEKTLHARFQTLALNNNGQIKLGQICLENIQPVKYRLCRVTNGYIPPLEALNQREVYTVYRFARTQS
jgi:hypothetical protein